MSYVSLVSDDAQPATLVATVKDKRGVTYTFTYEGPPRVVEIRVFDIVPTEKK